MVKGVNGNVRSMIAGACCAAVVMCSVDVNGMLPVHSDIEDKARITSIEAKLAEGVDRSFLTLADFAMKMDYKDILNCVPIYLADNHEFNESWWDLLHLIGSEQLLDLIMSGDLNELSKTVKKLYVWGMVTGEVICNYGSYLLSDTYRQTVSGGFFPVFASIRGDKSALLDNFVVLLLDSAADFPLEYVPFIHQFRWAGNHD